MGGGVGIGKWVENDFSVQTEEEGTDRVKYRDANTSKNLFTFS